MFRRPYQFNDTKIRLGTTFMALSLDDAEDGDVYSEPNDEK